MQKASIIRSVKRGHNKKRNDEKPIYLKAQRLHFHMVRRDSLECDVDANDPEDGGGGGVNEETKWPPDAEANIFFRDGSLSSNG